MNEAMESNAAVPAAAKPNARGRLRGVLAGAALLGALGWSAHALRQSFLIEKTDDAYVVGHVHRLGAGVPGPLLEVLADDNQEVKCGQLLARIDPLEFEIGEKKALAAREQAQAALQQAEAKAAQAGAADLQAEAAVSVAEAEIRQGESRLSLARITLARNEDLLKNGARAVAQAEADQARTEVEAATAVVAAGRAKLESARAGKSAAVANSKAAQAGVSAARADVDAGEAAIAEARRQLAQTRITAPADGRVGAKNAESGNRVQVGQSLYAVVEEDFWIVANFKETQLGKMRAGQAVDIEIDALGGRHFSGTVDSFAAATGAQFALLPPDNATGNFTKVVQRVPVKILLDPAAVREAGKWLRPGLSTVVRVRVG